MGFDISYHAVDRSIIVDRLIPYIQGRGQIDDLLEDAVRIQRVSARTQEWKTLLGKTIPHKPPEESPSLFQAIAQLMQIKNLDTDLDKFREDLHLWGRPFLIAGREPEEVSRLFDAYMKVEPEHADELAAPAARALASEELDAPLSPEASGNDENVAALLREPLDILRNAYSAVHAGGEIEIDGEKIDPRELLADEAIFTILRFYTTIHPGWMARGYAWPTFILQSSSAGVPELFETPAHLFEPLIDEFPVISERLERTITENYMIGGYVRAENVPDLRQFLEKSQMRVMGWAIKNKCLPQIQVIFRKILEAVIYAEQHEMGFFEASELYSGPLGIVN